MSRHRSLPLRAHIEGSVSDAWKTLPPNRRRCADHGNGRLQERRLGLAVRQEDRYAATVRRKHDSAHLSFAAFGRRDAQHRRRFCVDCSRSQRNARRVDACVRRHDALPKLSQFGIRCARDASERRNRCRNRLHSAAVGLLSDHLPGKHASGNWLRPDRGQLPACCDFNRRAVWRDSSAPPSAATPSYGAASSPRYVDTAGGASSYPTAPAGGAATAYTAQSAAVWLRFGV